MENMNNTKKIKKIDITEIEYSIENFLTKKFQAYVMSPVIRFKYLINK